jgi:acetolactate synthase-1/3 small subunit
MPNIKKDTHTISFMVANKPGVLVRVALAFARRGYNIDALVVSPSFDPRYSRMTITAQGDPEILDQIIKQTGKLVDVVSAEEHTGADSIHKELALIKIKSTPVNKAMLSKMCKKYKAKVIDENSKTSIVELAGTTDELDEFEDFFKKRGIVEMVRSGKLVMAKGTEAT